MVRYTKESGDNMKKLPLLSILFIILSIAISSIYPQTMAQGSTIDSSVNEFLPYENSADGIRIKYPADWNVCEDSQTLTPGFVCPPLSITLSSLIVTFYPPPIDASDILSEIIEKLRTHQSILEEYLENRLGSSVSLSVWVFPSDSQSLTNHVSEKMKELENKTAYPEFNIVNNTYVTIGGSVPAYELSYTLGLPEILVEDGSVTYLYDDLEDKRVMEIWTIHDGKAYQFTYLAHPDIYSEYEQIIRHMIYSIEFI
jgi:hypothetical protein